MANRLASLAVLAILTFVPTGLRAQSSVLTADQQKKIAALLATCGKDVALRSAVTAALGVSKGDEVLTLRQLTATETRTYSTLYVPLPSGGVLIGLFDQATYWNYRLDENLKLIAAVSKQVGQPPVVIPMSDARIRFKLNFHTGLLSPISTDARLYFSRHSLASPTICSGCTAPPWRRRLCRSSACRQPRARRGRSLSIAGKTKD